MNVLITRPDGRGQELLEMLQQQNIFAIHQPLFTIEAGNDLPQLPSVIAQLNAGDYVFAVSKHAVNYAAETLRQTGFHFRNDLKYFAVGKSTAIYSSERLEQAVVYPIEAENSETVLALPEMQELSEKNILILRANTGRELLAEKAIQRGANVQYLECYRRQLVADNIPERISLCKRAGIDTIIVTSGEILTTLFEQTERDCREWLLDCKLIVVGLRIARIAKQMGWLDDKIVISEKADNLSLMNVLLT